LLAADMCTVPPSVFIITTTVSDSQGKRQQHACV
jgi:hypothetical protein